MNCNRNENNHSVLMEARKSLGLTQQEVANKLGVSKSSIGMYERGKRIPDEDMLNKLSKLYKVNKSNLPIYKKENNKLSKSIKVVPFKDLKDADLYLDAIYRGGNEGNVKDDPLSKLLSCGNLGGFRKKLKMNNYNDSKYAFLIIYSDFSQKEWNDSIDYETGTVVYYGDNRIPGKGIDETEGNQILKKIYEDLDLGDRKNIPPIFLFTKGSSGRDVIFRGLVVPGLEDKVKHSENLVARWYMKENKRFQNYEAKLTILDEVKVSRRWINDLINGNLITENTPKNYKLWVEAGNYAVLKVKENIKYRTKKQQLPSTAQDKILIKTLYDYFSDPTEFEWCAAELFKLMCNNDIQYNLTRTCRDGGRDLIGIYRIGLVDNHINVEFALEAKRYNENNSVGVKETSRLISRLRHRQFGVLITTSYLHEQAYKEILEDGHPIIVVSAIDIVNILRQNRINSKDKLINWLDIKNKEIHLRIH